MAHAPASSVLRAALVGGVVAAVVEMVFVLPIQSMLGASPELVFQSIAAGVLGKAAFTGGPVSAGAGVAAHLLISVVAAGVYAWAATREPALLRRPIVGGVIFGALAYLVMNFVVIPLSTIGFSTPKSWALALISLAVHLFAFGLPIGLVCRAVIGAPAPHEPPLDG